MLSIGNENDDDEKYIRLVSQRITRTKFIENVITFLHDNNFDGLDINWQYPKCHRCKIDENLKTSFALLINVSIIKKIYRHFYSSCLRF